MAFNSSNLILQRVSFVSPDKYINNNYFSSDPIATIIAPGYFPSYFGFDDNSVTINDCLKITSTSDNVVQEYLVTSVDPLLLSLIPAVGDTQYIDAPTSGAVVTDFPLYFYKNNVGGHSMSIPGPFSFTISAAGKISFPGLTLNPGFIPSYIVYFGLMATYLSQPFVLNFILNNSVPYLQLSNTFTIGQIISIDNSYINY